MKVLVTGGTGFIGVPLVKALLSRGDEVHLISHRESAATAFAQHPAFQNLKIHRLDLEQFARGDRGSGQLLEGWIAGCERVYHLAGFISYRNKDREKVRLLNVDGTRALVAAAGRAGLKRFVHVSSIVAVGVSWREDQVLNEQAEYNAAELHLEYFDSKHEAERVAREAAHPSLELVMANPATVVGFAEDAGPPGSVNRSLLLLAKAPLLLPGGNCWVDVRDVVDGILRVADRGRSGERYILGASNLSNEIVGRRLGRVIGGKRWRKRLRWPVSRRLAAALSPVFERLGSQALRRVSGFYLYFDASRARRDLDWQPRDPWPAMAAMVSAGDGRSS